LSDDAVRAKYSEITLRYVLTLEVLLSSGGKRHSVVANIRNGEVGAAYELDDGSIVVEVGDHKLRKLGPSQLIFCREGLFDGVVRYQHLFKYPEKPERRLFATENGSIEGGKFDLKHSIDWVKREFKEELLAVCTEEELSSLTAKSNRKGFSNWGYAHDDPTINRDVAEAQDHSVAIDMSNYHIKSGARAARVTRTILSDVVGASCSLDAPAVGAAQCEPAERPKVSRGFFTPKEKRILLKGLGKPRGDGSFDPPSLFPTNDRIARASILVEGFREVYDAALKKKGGKRSRANNLIWTSIRAKKSKIAKTVKPSDSESESQQDDSEADTDARGVGRRSFSYGAAEEFRRKYGDSRKRKKPTDTDSDYSDP